MTFILITCCLLLTYVALILYYRARWRAVKDFIPSIAVEENELPYISIIIAARNEEQNIGKCIKTLISQSYPHNKFEVIVVNDHSTDRTIEVIHSFKKENIHVINLEDFTKNEMVNSYKKRAIDTALQFAKGTLIITTDADCTAPQKWLQTVASFYKETNSVFIAMPVAFTEPLPGDSFLKRFFSIFQSLDFMTLQGITAASVYKGFHSMCNGANLAYEKKAFYEVNGFEGIDEIASGDDMLLMHKIKKRYPDRVSFLKSPEVIVETQPAQTLREFINQRVRWASKADKYTDKKITLVLVLVYFLNAWIFILGIFSLFFTKMFYLFLISICIKTIVELVFLYPVAKFFNKQKTLWWFIPSQPFHIVYTLIAGWLGKFGTYRWKGRKVK